MTAEKNLLSCQEFQNQLPELIGAGEDISLHPHLRSCALCRALLADLEAIAAAARQLLPIEDPPEELWEHIEIAIKEEEHSAAVVD